MAANFFRTIQGYLRIRVTGYAVERFLNACGYRGIFLWGITPLEDACEMNIRIADFRKLKPVMKKTGTRVIILKRIGLPFFFYRYRRRKLFFFGAAACAVLIFLLSGLIWDIDIRGNLMYTDETILEFLASKDIQNGMLKTQIDCERIAKDIRKEYSDVIWVSASVQGTKLKIQVKENTDASGMETDLEAKKEEKAPMDLVADKDCVITEIVPRTGMIQVRPGDTVKEGDVLVSGLIPVQDDVKEIIGYQYQKADADIRGKAILPYEDVLENTYSKKVYFYEERPHQMRKRQAYYLRIGRFQLAFGNLQKKEENQELHTSEYQICLGKRLKLPIYLGTRTVIPYTAHPETYKKKEIQERLSADFKRYLGELEKKGVEIIENNVKIYTGSKTSAARGELTVLLPVGTLKASQIPEIPEISELPK